MTANNPCRDLIVYSSLKIHIPLQFYFSRPEPISEEDIKNYAKKLNDLLKSIDYSHNNTDYYDKMKQLVWEHRQEYYRAADILFPPILFDGSKSIWDHAINEIDKKSMIHCPSFFWEVPVILDDNHNINGYQLYPLNNDFMDWMTFYKIVDLWNDNRYKKWKFKKKFYQNSSYEWHKFDRLGNYFSGFYKTHPEKAWNLCWSDNVIGLWELPYPHDTILYFASFDTLDQSVRWVNSCCEWVKRKREINL